MHAGTIATLKSIRKGQEPNVNIVCHTFHCHVTARWRMSCLLCSKTKSTPQSWRYRIVGNFRGGGEIYGWTTNILPTNEATLTTFTCSASSNHKNKIDELTKIVLLNHEYFSPPSPKITAIRYLCTSHLLVMHVAVCLWNNWSLLGHL